MGKLGEGVQSFNPSTIEPSPLTKLTPPPPTIPSFKPQILPLNNHTLPPLPLRKAVVVKNSKIKGLNCTELKKERQNKG